jgi:hypothetical protein
MRRCAALAGLAVVAIAGCFESSQQTRIDPQSIFRASKPMPVAPASIEAASRVHHAGQAILSANASLGIKPMFRTIGSPKAELFHRGTSEIFITEGMVRLCPTEPQLAAVLCMELGKMVTEREAARLAAGQPDIQPPIDVPLTRDVANAGTEPDQTRVAELIRYEQEKNARPASPKLPDPEKLAREFLRRTGFPPASLDGVRTQLKAATSADDLEKQFTGSLPAMQWGGSPAANPPTTPAPNPPTTGANPFAPPAPRTP